MPSKPKSWRDNLSQIVVAVILIVLLLVIIASHYTRVPGRRNQAELKANLHTIQLSIERYAVDHDGNYPRYLIGGEPGSAGADWASDPLLRDGYIDAYPRNPFARPTDQPGELDVLALQEKMSTSRDGSDPLCPGNPAGDRYGYRFGQDGGTMGQVLCDTRCPTWMKEDPATGELSEQPTWADVEYHFWDVWVGNKPKPYSPGQFFYKSNGPVIARADTEDPEDDPVIIPLEIDQYILGIYGDLRTKGKDVLGDFPEPLQFSVQLPVDRMSSDTKPAGSFTWYPGTDSTLDPDGRGGSPFSPPEGQFDGKHLWYGCPNGIRDGIILVLTDGEDYIGDR